MVTKEEFIHQQVLSWVTHYKNSAVYNQTPKCRKVLILKRYLEVSFPKMTSSKVKQLLEEVEMVTVDEEKDIVNNTQIGNLPIDDKNMTRM